MSALPEHVNLAVCQTDLFAAALTTRQWGGVENGRSFWAWDFFGELKGDRTCNISENAKARTVKGSFFPQKFIARRFFYLDLVSVIVWTLETTLWLTDMIEFLVWYFWCLNWTQFDQLFFISPCFLKFHHMIDVLFIFNINYFSINHISNWI